MKPKGYWKNKENCRVAASKCSCRRDFQHRYSAGYLSSLKNKWIDEFFPSLKNENNPVHCVYYFLFESMNSVYVGRTLQYRIGLREKEHHKKGGVCRFALKNKLVIPTIVVKYDKLNLAESLIKEDELIILFRNNGYNIINKAKTGLKSGAIGALGYGHLSYEYCYNIALKCRNKNHFKKTDESAYNKSRKNGWIGDYVWFVEGCKKPNYWNNENNCYNEFLKYNSIKDFSKGNPTAYYATLRNKWMKKFCYKRGIKTRTSSGKEILQIDNKGNIINIFETIANANSHFNKKRTNSNINRALKNNSLAYGYFWKYAEERR